MSLIGPLTTTFTAPSQCAASFSTDFKVNGDYDVMGPVSTDDGCFPSHYTYRTDAYYSPGVCPQGLAAVCMTPFPQDPEVTIATCCPTGYTCNPTPPVVQDTTYVCNSRFSNFIGPVVSISGGTTAQIISLTTENNPIAIANALGVIIWYGSTLDSNAVTSSVSIIRP
jgi:hypothetical protein